MLQELRHVVTDWEQMPSSTQLTLSSEALKHARLIIDAQAQMFADHMDRGSLPNLDGPDALRLLAMILDHDDPAPAHQQKPSNIQPWPEPSHLCSPIEALPSGTSQCPVRPANQTRPARSLTSMP